MAEDTIPNVEKMIEESSTAEQVEAMAAVEVPKNIYKLDPNTKVPVSRHEGPVWKGRKDAGMKLMSATIDGWNEAEAYYGNSQMNHRKSTEGESAGNEVASRNRGRKFSSTENVVYATVNAVIPSIYAKNPNIDITMTDKEEQDIGVALKRFANNLAARQDAPGISLKPRMRKSIMRCEVTNEAWALIGYTMREDSADQARADIEKISTQLIKAKDEKTIEELEGQLLALEEQCDLLNPAGPFVMTLRGDQVIVDPGSTEDDHMDANWKMAYVMFPTNYLNARYRQKDKDGKYVSVYKPTHVVDATSSNSGGDGRTEEQREIDNFQLFTAGTDNPANYGYQDRHAYDRAKRTKVWYCFDKVKRRFYLYADNDWTWPIWVFNDPYQLPNFYPLRKLQYHTDPKKNRTLGEVSHYLDAQDDINTIVDELNRSRTALRDKTLFDSTALDAPTVESIMLNPIRKVLGIKVPDGKKLDELIGGPPLPALEHQHLWDKGPSMAAVNQISGIGDAQRGEQFKTNTTNQAIEYYSSVSGVRLDEKRDAIEDFVGGIMHDVIFLCLQFMPREEMAEIAGSEHAEAIMSLPIMTPRDIRKKLQMRVEGGSTQKPTSAAKKAEALQVGQVLGQFAGSMPAAGIIALQVFERAFDSVVISAGDWKMIWQTLIQGLSQGNNAPGGGAGAAAGAGAEQPTGEGGGSPEEEDAVKQVVSRAKERGQEISPDEARAAIRKRTQAGPQQVQ